MFISILTPLDGIVGSLRLHFKSVFLLGDNIVNIDGFQGDGAAYAAFISRLNEGPFSMETLLMMLGST